MPSDLLERLRRVTSDGRFIPEVDGLRFIAIALVVLFHIHVYVAVVNGFALTDHHSLRDQRGLNPLVYLVSRGDVGVPLFFVLSGFVLAQPFARNILLGGPPVRLRRYFLRRLTRLEPPYLAALILSFSIVALFSTSVDLSWRALATSGVYLYDLVYGQMPPFNIPFWSLEVEVQFYLLAPLIARLYSAGPKWLRRAGWLAAIALAAVLQSRYDMSPRVAHSLAGHVQYFLAGFLLADFYVADWGAASQPMRGGAAITFIGWPLMFVLLHRGSPFLVACGLPLLIIALYAAVLGRSFGTRWLSTPGVYVVGGACYSIYLLHMPVIQIAGKAVRSLGVVGGYTTTLLVQAPPLICAVTVTSFAYYLAIERPCMDKRWPAKLWNAVRARVGGHRPVHHYESRNQLQ